MMEIRPIDGNARLEGEKEWSKDAGFYTPIYEGFKKRIKAAPTLDLAPKWISVYEEYPEDLKLVLLAYADNGYVDIGYYDESFAEWDDLSDSKILRPTHWMPLPEPPKEECK